jgi:hypothetical protein
MAVIVIMTVPLLAARESDGGERHEQRSEKRQALPIG